MSNPAMKPQPLPPEALRRRALNGAYPFRDHRTCAEVFQRAPYPGAGEAA